MFTIDILVNVVYIVNVILINNAAVSNMEKTNKINTIIELQRKVDRARRGYETEIWMELPVTMAQLKSLFFISNNGNTNLRKLAEALNVTSTNTTGIIDRLVKQGLVDRSEDPTDRRMLFLCTTAKGEELVTRLRERKRGYLKEVLSRMNDTDLQSLADGLKAFIEAGETKD